MSSAKIYHHPGPNAAWLARRVEDALDPELPIVDPHHHLWDRPGDRYFLDELLVDTGSGHNIVATVFVQCGWAYRTDGPEALRPVGETEFVAAVADEAERRRLKTRVCAAIVGHVDLRLGEGVEAVLDAHLEAAGGRFRGIRQVTARSEDFVASILAPPPAGMMADAAFRAGFARLGKFGLSFDAWLYHTQINELTDLARAFPEIPIVIDHVGGPLGIGPYQGKREEVFASWHGAMQQLAGCRNVSVKLGGLGMLVAGFALHEQAFPPSSEELADLWRPYMEACIEDFGAWRCMFESNFPVDKAMCSYPILWNAFKRIAAGASATEKALLFHDVATKVYRLPT
ncbi:MAG: amidohydrolase family protein [Rhodopila sp.]|jgi:predicted TIM-barrel fold metal-dependent hydrolase